MSALTEPIRARLQETLSGQRTGVPDWITAFEAGTDAGYFGPGSAVWAVHGGMPTLVAGIRALLMQSLHPGALAGVHDWSDYQKNPLARLAGTIRWIFTVSYGDTTQAVAGSDWVKRLHERIVGGYVDGHGRERRYAANDPELSSWVHVAFTDAFLSTHELWGAPIPGGGDRYVQEWAKAGEMMGVAHPPHSVAELKAQLHAFADAGELRRDSRVDDVVRFVRRPPLRTVLKPSYRVLFAGAVCSLEPRFRDMLGLHEARLGPVRLPVVAATGFALRRAGSLLGPQTQGELAARRRLARLAVAE
ncbi:oxygenase MpaB family protein [Rathayibacter soli]|uniref:oxygenase MpaB family protein n=1 Tax=Rathayibacter soli TaxID=3144168 RepID=UPI0027E3C3EF|nr:oxygenase MpaB family protein [Glaciibacter superstes]